MSLDTPAKIIILGAGPIGLEAALYARFLGYQVAVYERGPVCAAVRSWAHARMFSPFGLNRSTLGLAACAAQDRRYRPPGDLDLLTGQQWLDRYLLPLAATDLLADHLREGCLVTRVTATLEPPVLEGAASSDDSDNGDADQADDAADFSPEGEAAAAGDPDDDAPAEPASYWQVVYRDPQGREQRDVAHAVIDATGALGAAGDVDPARGLGPGGALAEGEAAARARFDFGCPDLLGAARARFAGKHVLLAGGGLPAAINLAALLELHREAPATRVTWLPPAGADPRAPIAFHEQDPLSERRKLAQHANYLAGKSKPPLAYRPEAWLEAIEHRAAGDEFLVRLGGPQREELLVDRVLFGAGPRGDWSPLADLRLERDLETGGLARLARALRATTHPGLVARAAGELANLAQPEPRLFVLGAKSYGARDDYLFAVGLEQIRAVFAHWGDRAGLNLYEHVKKLAP